MRSPYVPQALRELAECGDYLAQVGGTLERSIATAGFLGSALYLADMASDAAEEVYEPLATREDFHAAGADEPTLQAVEAALDVFHWVQPQLLLVLGALAEAWDRPRVGGRGRPEPRETSERERAHLAIELHFTPPGEGLLPEIAELVGVDEAPELYRSLAGWPAYLETAWQELQHLVAYPRFRQRGRALYYYARSSARFLAEPLEANRETLRERGLADADLDRVEAILKGTMPTTATMMMHAAAMRVGLGIRTREVVKQE